eukprot:10787934-Lingulodinium_polyedra.AAC.1
MEAAAAMANLEAAAVVAALGLQFWRPVQWKLQLLGAFLGCRLTKGSCLAACRSRGVGCLPGR